MGNKGGTLRPGAAVQTRALLRQGAPASETPALARTGRGRVLRAGLASSPVREELLVPAAAGAEPAPAAPAGPERGRRLRSPFPRSFSGEAANARQGDGRIISWPGDCPGGRVRHCRQSAPCVRAVNGLNELIATLKKGR